jgi:hypothetical protein
MHPYQIDEAVRTRIFLICASFALALGYTTSLLVRSFQVEPPWWLEYPSAFGLFTLFVAAYNRYLWNRRPFSSLPWLQIPSIAGRWNVRLASSHDSFGTELSATALIRQTGSKLSISLDAPESTSHSLSASLLPLETLTDFQLTYHYLNTPKPSAPASMVPHYGVAVLRFSSTPLTLDGEYFSGRGRHQHGDIHLTRDGQAA